MDLAGAVIDWWRRHHLSAPRIRGTIVVPARSMVPEPIPRRSLVVVGVPTNPKWLLFQCPCGNGHQVELNLQSSHSPRWQLAHSRRGEVTVTPSVDVHGERRCHFWLTSGRVRWVTQPARRERAGHLEQSRRRQQ